MGKFSPEKKNDGLTKCNPQHPRNGRWATVVVSVKYSGTYVRGRFNSCEGLAETLKKNNNLTNRSLGKSVEGPSPTQANLPTKETEAEDFQWNTLDHQRKRCYRNHNMTLSDQSQQEVCEPTTSTVGPKSITKIGCWKVRTM